MGGTKPRVFATVGATFRDIFGLLPRDGALLRYFAYGTVSTWIARLLLLQLFLRPAGLGPQVAAITIAGGLTRLIWSVLGEAAALGLLTPLVVAVHRKVLLGESPFQGYFASLAGPRARTFFTAAFTITALYLGLMRFPRVVIVPLLRSNDLVIASALVSIGLILIGGIVTLVIGIRLAPAFPAIALGRSRSWLASGFTLSRGVWWRIFWPLVIAGLPVGIPLVLVWIVWFYGLMNVTYDDPSQLSAAVFELLSSPGFVIFQLATSALQALLLVIWADVVSHIYRALMHFDAVEAF